MRQRGKYIRQMLEQALPATHAGEDDHLYQAALAVQQDQDLSPGMEEWEAATIGDGLGDADPPAKRR